MRTSARLSGRAAARREAAPSCACSLQQLQQSLTVTGGHPVTHRTQIGDEAVERVDDRSRVLGTDVGPDARVPGRDAGHVAEPPGSQSQKGTVLLCSRTGRVHERGGHQVGDVGHHRDQPVVVGCRKHQHVRAETHDDVPQAVEGLEIRGGSRGEHPHGALKEIGVGSVQPHLLGPGHRMATDEAGMGRRLDDGTLHPADIGDHGVGAPARVRQHGEDHAWCGGGRNGHEDDLGIGIVARGVDDPTGDRVGEPRLVEIETRHVPSPAAQAEGHGAPDEPRPDDQCTPACGGLSRGGHRGALGHRGGTRDGSRRGTSRCARAGEP